MSDSDFAPLGGLIRARDLSDYRLTREVRNGSLTQVAPGLYSAPDPPADIRCKALCLHDPLAVITGRAAARLWWPDLTVTLVEAARVDYHRPRPGFRWSRRQIPPDQIAYLDGIRFTSPALTTLDLIPELGGEVIDEALRRRATTLDQLHEALRQTPRRLGNELRALLLKDSRDEPWSEAERSFHRIIRGVDLSAPYRTNFPVRCGGLLALLDVAIPQLRLGFEIDGYAYHSSRAAFEHDRERDICLALAGWHVHHFSAAAVFDRPEWVARSVEKLVRSRK